MTTGVVLMTYGAPSGAHDLPSYLARVRGGRVPPDELIAEMRRRYERIGWSPLVRITALQAEALEGELGPAAHRVVIGMRFSEPTIAQAVSTLVATGAERVVGIVLSPQWSPRLMDGYRAALEAAVPSGVPWVVAGAWHREPAFIDAIAGLVRDALAELGPDETRIPIVMTAHSLPKRVFDAEPGYVAQLRETAELVATRLGLAPDRWHWAYQSAGHSAEEWLRPDLKELFPALAAAGHRGVLVVPVQFLADHLEVLYDLDVAAAEEARASGLQYRRIHMPNDHPAFIQALAGVVRSVSAEGAAATVEVV